MAYIEEWQADITVQVDGVQIGDLWSTYSGGTKAASSSKTRPGGMGKEVSVGGPASRDDLTCTVQFSEVYAAKHAELEGKIGTSRVKVTVVWLDNTRSAIPNSSFSRVGTLQSVMEPPSDAGSNTVGFYTLVVNCDEDSPST